METRLAETIGKFQLVAELGHGAMADVFLAVARGPVGFSKLQVLKVLRPAHADVPEVLALFLDEARLSARLNHPNVVQTSEVCHEGDRVYLVMEYLEGQTLDRVLRRARRQGGLPEAMQCRALAGALAGLHHAHELRDFDGTPLDVVHRGVRPENLFLTYDGQIKVVDFGIAKAANCSAETQGGALKGKVHYMAPEQAMGHAVDRRADLFAVGLMLWEAATGAKFWGERSEIQVLHHLSQGDLPPLRAIPPELPPALRPICLRALAVDPAARYATAAEFQADLESVLQIETRTTSAREVGERVAELFVDKRAEVRELIEQQLNGLRITDRGGSVLAPARLAQSGTFAGLRDASTASHERRASPSTRPVEGDRPGSPSTALAVGAMAGGFMMLAVMAIRALTSPVQLPAGAQGAPAQEISAHLRASPPDARLFLDGVALARNPFEGPLPRDGASHRLLATAPGHEARAELVSFASDLSLEIALVPVAASAPASAPGAASASAPGGAASSAHEHHGSAPMAPAISPGPRDAAHSPPLAPAAGSGPASPAASGSPAPPASGSTAPAPPASPAPDEDLVAPRRAPLPGLRSLDREDPWAAPGGSAAPPR